MLSNPLSDVNLSKMAYSQISEDAQERIMAHEDFAQIMGTARSKRLQAMITMRSRKLHDLSAIPATSYITEQRYSGVQAVPLKKIIGSENRTNDFDIDFLPTTEHLEERWVRVQIAYLRGIKLPAVELIQVGNDYYVRDGHHRISVARRNGQETIDAVVTVYEMEKAS